MEDTKDQMSEALLDGWLQMSTAISNERLVKAMTYNESMVCGFLYRQRKEEGEALTATELCRRLSMKKSQMNLVLNRLESQEIIRRGGRYIFSSRTREFLFTRRLTEKS